MQMYVNYFDRFVKTGEENPTMGIVLCKRKNQALVEITLPKDANIHAREYQLYLPSKDELQQKLMEWIEERGAGMSKESASPNPRSPARSAKPSGILTAQSAAVEFRGSEYPALGDEARAPSQRLRSRHRYAE